MIGSTAMPPGTRTEKPWGFEELLLNDRYAVKKLHIERGCRLSLQYHEHKRETILVLQGAPLITLGEREIRPAVGEVVDIPAGAVHRFEACDEDVVLFEVSTPELEDVVRVDDDYGRTTLAADHQGAMQRRAS